jgi:hypothetical protein
MIKPKDIFIGRARKYNHFERASAATPGRSCSTCVRRTFSFPYTCSDGWPAGDPQWKDRGAECLNWTDNPKCDVD